MSGLGSDPLAAEQVTPLDQQDPCPACGQSRWTCACHVRLQRVEADLAAANRRIERLRAANDAYWSSPQGDRVRQRQRLMDVLYDLYIEDPT